MDSKVMRLSLKEEKLIRFIRTTPSTLATQLNTLIENNTQDVDCREAKKLISILNNSFTADLELLISQGFISQTLVENTLKAISENKNVVITGMPGVGKTTLTKAIISQFLNEFPFLVVNRTSEYDEFNKVLNRGAISFEDLDLLSRLKDGKIVFDELSSSKDFIEVLTALSIGIPFILICHNVNWRENFLQQLPTALRSLAQNLINKEEFVEIAIRRTTEPFCFSRRCYEIIPKIGSQ